MEIRNDYEQAHAGAQSQNQHQYMIANELALKKFDKSSV